MSDVHSHRNINSCNSREFFFSSLLPPSKSPSKLSRIISQHNSLTYCVWTLSIENWSSNNNVLTVRGLISLSIEVNQIDHSHRLMCPLARNNSFSLPLSLERVLLAYRIRRKTVLDTLLTRAFILVTNNVIESRSWDRRATGSALPVFVLLRSPSRRNLDRKRCAQTIAESSMEMQTNLKITGFFFFFLSSFLFSLFFSFFWFHSLNLFALWTSV